MGGSQGASTSTFFSFAIAIDEGKTSVNQLRCLNPGNEYVALVLPHQAKEQVRL